MKNGQPVTDETRECFAEVAELPDLWDLTVQDWDIEMGISRFVSEGSLSTHTSYIKKITSKPVVSVGRFTSPDTMVNQIKRGFIDLIGAARPSIADPFLPKKIEEGRIEDIRECIGSGPAGLEAAHALGKRGYSVLLSEARTELGGRVTPAP